MTTTVEDLKAGDIVKVADRDAADYIGVPVDTLAVVRRAVKEGYPGFSYVDVEWSETSIDASTKGWNADRFVKVASLSPVGAVVYLTKDSSDGKNGIEAYRDNQWPLRGTVETAPYVPAPSTLDRGYTVRLDDGSLVFATQRMIESTTVPAPAPLPVPEVDLLSAEVRRLQDQINRMNAWKETLVSDAHEYANDSNLCEAFDEFMEQHGLPARTGEYEVEVRFTVSARVRVEARDEAEAEREAESRALGMRVDMDLAIEREVDLTGVDTDFENALNAERQS